MKYSDMQLKQALAVMLPDVLRHCSCGLKSCHTLHNPRWKNNNANVKDTELLHLCWLVEETLTNNDCHAYDCKLRENAYTQDNKLGWFFHATWQQRVMALAKVKGISI